MKHLSMTPPSVAMRISLVSLPLLFGGCLTDDSDGGGGGADQVVETREATLGSHDNPSVGSAIDLDSMQTFTYADAAQHASGIDLFYAFSETEQAEAFYAPATAKAGFQGSQGFGGGVGGPVDWANANDTPLRTVTVLDFDAIDKRQELDSLWNTGAPVTGGRLLVAEGLEFMAETDRGMRTLIQVQDIQPGPEGTSRIKVRATFPQASE